MVSIRSMIVAVISALALTSMGSVSNAQCTSSATVYNGSGWNRDQFENISGPNIGQNWITEINLRGDDVSIIVLGVGGTAPPGIKLGNVYNNGELLCLPPLLSLGVSTTGCHSIPVPNDPSLVGRTFCTQGATIEYQPLSVTLHNALIICIGS